MTTEPEALALATLLSHMRKDWNPQGVLSLIHKHGTTHDFPALARAAVNAAANPNNRTPKVIFMQGAHWINPATATASDHRLQRGFELMQRAANRTPQPNPFDSQRQWPAPKGIES